MSFDLTIKSDESYSRSTPRAALEAFISQMPGIERNGSAGFVLNKRPKLWMEIYLEAVREEGDNIEESGKTYDEINRVKFCIPYGFLNPAVARFYLIIAFAIADYIGWALYDDQCGKPYPRTKLPPGA